MDIVIVADFVGKLNNTGNNRFEYLANLLSESNSVEIITSNFNHGDKKHFEEIPKGFPYKITMLREPSYPTNVCVQRFYSHFVWGKEVKKYLQNRKKPDVVYCAMPTLMASYEAAKYCEKNGVRFVVDVQDLWPEAFQMVFNIPILSNMIFAPFHWLANGAYKRADSICAVSDTYVNRALSVNRKTQKGHTVFLGTKLEDFDANVKCFSVEDIHASVPNKKEDDLWLAYCGTLGSSYDLICVFDALEMLKKQGVKSPTFIVMGDGPRRTEFEEYAVQKKIDVYFTGRLPYAQMCGLLCMCDITVNPIMRGAAQSIINKHADYVASGLPVLNTQECEEYRNLVDSYQMGFNCRNNDAEDLANKMIQLLEDEELRKQMGRNARKCAQEKFDRKYTYQELINEIFNCIKREDK